MGINRHTPKAILYGPMCLGGFALHDIYCDQIIQHFIKINQHIRRQDNAGKAFLCNLNTYKVLLGSATQMFELSRARYMYVGETNTTVYYMWKMSTTWCLNMRYMGINSIQQKGFQGIPLLSI